MNSYLLKGCRKCGGDLARDCGDWICLQCGSCYYVGLYRRGEPAAEPPGAAASQTFPVVLPGTALPGLEANRAAEKAAAFPGTGFPAAFPSGAAYPAGLAVIR